MLLKGRWQATVTCELYRYKCKSKHASTCKAKMFMRLCIAGVTVPQERILWVTILWEGFAMSSSAMEPSLSSFLFNLEALLHHSLSIIVDLQTIWDPVSSHSPGKVRFLILEPEIFLCKLNKIWTTLFS